VRNMQADAEGRIPEHNATQLAYYGAGIKQTMVPCATPYVRRQLDRFLAFAGIQPTDRLLDVGCGMGRYTLPLADQGFLVEGLDLSPYLLDRLREYAAGRHAITLHCADLLDYRPELAGRFDAVIGFFTLHHLHDLGASFEAMAQLVKPGGTIAFLEPNALNGLYYLQILFTSGMTWEGDRGVARMRRPIVFEAMADSGLTDLKLLRFGFFPPLVTNRPWGAPLEAVLERVPFWRPLLPFQIFKGTKP